MNFVVVRGEDLSQHFGDGAQLYWIQVRYKTKNGNNNITDLYLANFLKDLDCPNFV